jgi:protoheme IX farnesyltransferase
MMDGLRVLIELTKFRISLLVTLSAAAGFLLARRAISTNIFMAVLGVFLLAGGACALNQYQEKRIDGLMARTRNRPLPSGRVRARTALLISLTLISLGSSMIFVAGGGLTASGLGLFAVAWYNGFYTYLKRKTAFAAVPGALIGAVPPALGWVCGGGALLDGRILGIASFFFIWQVPHFWLLFLDFADEYERAGLPSLKKIFTSEQLRRILSLWILSAAVSSLSIPLFGFVNSYPALVLLLVGSFWMIWNGMYLLRNYSDGISLKEVFTKLNVYVFAVILLLFLDVVSLPVFLP